MPGLEREPRTRSLSTWKRVYILYTDNLLLLVSSLLRDALSHNTYVCMYLYLIAGNLRRLNLGELHLNIYTYVKIVCPSPFCTHIREKPFGGK